MQYDIIVSRCDFEKKVASRKWYHFDIPASFNYIVFAILITIDEMRYTFNFRAIPSDVTITFDNCDIKFLEHVQVNVSLYFPRRGDLGLALEAPTGTTSPLTRYRMMDNVLGGKTLTNWVITTLFNWGESPEGQWKLKITNLKPQFQTTGKNMEQFFFDRR